MPNAVCPSLIALWLPVALHGSDRRAWLEEHVDTPEPTRPLERERIQGIVDNWPQQVDGSRAEAIGLPRPPELKVIVGQYVEDFLRS